MITKLPINYGYCGALDIPPRLPHAANMDEVKTMLLGLGAAVVVESPHQLRQQIQQEAAKIVAAYGTNHSSST